jgi:hypothetical protein
MWRREVTVPRACRKKTEASLQRDTNNLDAMKKAMNPGNSLKPRLQAGVGLALLAGALYLAPALLVTGADTKTTDSKSKDAKATEANPETKTEKKKLTGAELYAMHCNRCHPERYATEWTAAQWKTLMTHMRVRASLPAAQAKELLKYLQEDSGN